MVVLQLEGADTSRVSKLYKGLEYGRDGERVDTLCPGR